MRPRTVAVLAAVLLVLAGGGAYALVSVDGGELSVVWVSDTPRNTSVNHHGVGANAGVVVAPASEPGGSNVSRFACSLVRLDATEGATDWRWPVPEDRCFLHALTRPAVADLDGDGRQAVIAGTIEEETVALDAADGSQQFAIPMDTYSYGQPTVARLGEDDPAVVASDIRGGVVVAAADGTVRWRANVSGSVWASPLVVDLDGDRTRAVVVGSSDELVAVAADGEVRWRRSVSARDVAVARTGDGVRVVTAGFEGVAAFDATGNRTWDRSGLASPRLTSVGDGDGDGTPEAYLSVAGSELVALDATDGSEEWRSQLTSSDTTTPPPVLADVSGDGDPELVAATGGGTVAVLAPADGAELAAYERDVPVLTPVTPANLTDDPGREILVRYGDGRVVALRYG